jgi:heme/copper-type cytochrome/quinol oxidase subunit 4
VTRLDFLKRAEFALAVLLTATALFLLVIRATHAGALWRDECAVVNLARMPSLADITRNFQHEAFPFPILIRAYTNVFGSSDTALRSFGIAAGVALLGALWFSAHLTARGPPLVSLALVGLNTTFLFWGTTARGYGLGSALIVLAFGLFASVMLNPSRSRIIAAAVISIAAVQCLVHNLALMFALVASAAIVWLIRRDLRQLIIFSLSSRSA